MPQKLRLLWEPSGGLSSRRQSRSFYYHAHIPDRIADWRMDLPSEVVAEMLQVHHAIQELQGISTSTGLEALSRQLLRAESIASSRIEGLRLSQRRLARAAIDPKAETETARSVMGNIEAMAEALRLGEQSEKLSLNDILQIHRLLLQHTQDKTHAGTLRREQNWIGGSDWSPQGAEFIPPPATEVEPLMQDLCAFLMREDLPPIIQAAIAHAQFETIHPFIDGNGRVGRALIHLALRHRKVALRVVPPVSLILAANAQRYVDGLTAYREGHILDWLSLFMRALESATQQAKVLGDELKRLQAHWLEVASNPRKHSAARKIIEALPANPVLDSKTATRLTGGSEEGARLAINALTELGILSTAVIGKKRNRIWEARALFDQLDRFEWALATPTRSDQARRPAPSKKSETRKRIT